MIAECQSCGAPLDVTDNVAHVKCSYCGISNRVRTMKTLSQLTPPGWTPPPQWQTPPHLAGARRVLTYGAGAAAASAGLSGCVGVSIALVLVVAAAGIAAAIVATHRGTPTLAAPTWSGVAPLRCGGHETVHVDALNASLPGQTAIIVRGHCTVELTDCTIVSQTGIRMSQHGRVVLRGTTLLVTGDGITADGHADVSLEGSTIRAGGVGIDASDHVHVQLRGGRVEGSPRAVRTSRHARVDTNDTVLVDGASGT